MLYGTVTSYSYFPASSVIGALFTVIAFADESVLSAAHFTNTSGPSLPSHPVRLQNGTSTLSPVLKCFLNTALYGLPFALYEAELANVGTTSVLPFS